MAEQKAVRRSADPPLCAGTDTEVDRLLRNALLKLSEYRPDEPVAFLADYFACVAAQEDAAPLQRALWHLSVTHHSHRHAFNSSVRAAYELLLCGAGVPGARYADLLRAVCVSSGVSTCVAGPLLSRVACAEREAAPFEVFRRGVLACAVFADFTRQARVLHGALNAREPLCRAALDVLRDALDTPRRSNASRRLLEASVKVSPREVARAMARACAEPERDVMDLQEFEEAAASLFIARVQPLA